MGHPTVEVTLLFTDIEGSTALAHELGNDYVELLGQHNRIIRDAIGHHVGVEARNEGDAFFAAFDRAADAVQAALDAQRALAAHEWASGRPVRVRMGLHTGPVIRLLHDFAGLNVHLASRISGAAHGGQVVASQAVLDALDADAYEWSELGAHIVKDFPEPVTLFQLRADGLETRFPPLVTIDARDHNLPAMVTSFVGRQGELVDLRTLLLSDARLVTITGPGGAGKTRLAVETTWSVLSRFRTGAWFVDFASVTNPDAIIDTIVETLGVRERDDLRLRFREGPALLVLDNLEQLLSGVTAISGLLTECPKLVVVATTRERLRLQGEYELRLDGLDEPEALELLSARALLVQRDFVADDRAKKLCARLGGLPLAIELAAARLRTLSLDGLLAAMDQMLDTLSEGERDRPSRHQAMRAAIAVSVDALTEAERSVFRGFSVFAGGATREAIAAVCSPKADEVQSLVDKSLLRAIDERLTMLEPIRQFAEELLASEVPGEREQRIAAHSQVFLEFVERMEPLLVTVQQSAALDALTADHANLRLACARGADDAPLRMSAALTRFWIYRGHAHEGRAVLASVLAARTGAAEVRARALLGAGHLALLQHDLSAARAALEEVVDLRIPSTEPAARNLLGEVDRLAGDSDGAAEQFANALRLAEQVGDARLAGLVKNNQALLAFGLDKLEDAIALWREALLTAEEVGDLPAMARALGNLGLGHRRLGAFEAAADAFARSLEVARSLGDRGAQASALQNLAAVRAEASGGELTDEAESEAAAYLREAIKIFDELGYRRELANALLGMPSLLNDLDECLYALSRARALFTELDDAPGVKRAEALRSMLLSST